MHNFTKKIQKFWFSLCLGLVVVVSVSVLTVHDNRMMQHEGGWLPVTHATSQTALLPALTETSRAMAAATKCGGNVSGKLLLVSVSQQHIWACNGMQLTKESAVTTGASALKNVDDATPVGTWHIYAKHTNTMLKGCDANGCWNDPVSYWMPFDGAVGFHDASWQTFPFGGVQYTIDGSHGCVHLPTAMAAWVYSWAPVGTTVTVQA